MLKNLLKTLNQRKKKKDKLFSQQLEDYIESKKKKLALTTYLGYKSMTERIIKLLDEMGYQNLMLSEVDTELIDKFFDYLRDKKGNTVCTCKKYANVIRPALRKAQIYEYISKNPYDAAEELTRAPHEEKEGEAFNKEELELFFTLAQGHELERIWKITYWLALRSPSEPLGLRWSQIDFENNKILIRGVAFKVKGKWVFEEKKNKTIRSRATFGMSPKLRETLLSIKADIEKNKAYFGNSYNIEYEDFVCVNELGELYNPSYLGDKFLDLVEKLNLTKNLTQYSLRHTAATLFYKQTKDIIKTMQYLRHTDTRTTQRYVHANEEDMDESVFTMTEEIVNF